MTCETCKWAHTETAYLKCRRFPPQHDFSIPYPNKPGFYPTVKPDYFCGEYSTTMEEKRQRGRPKKTE